MGRVSGVARESRKGLRGRLILACLALMLGALAQRDVWVSKWKLAKMGGMGVSWSDVADAIEVMDRAGTLAPTDRPFLDEAR